MSSPTRKLIGACLLGYALQGSCGDLIDINSANAQTLADGIVGVGIARAEAIVDYRTEHGPFKTVDDLLLVKGIGSATVDKNRDKLTVQGTGP